MFSVPLVMLTICAKLVYNKTYGLVPAEKENMKTKIGGQAVIEGVMMRGTSSMALSVRDETGQIRVETKRLPAKKPWYRKVPFLRGVINLVTSMVDGFKIIGKSAEVMVEDEIDTSDGKGMGGLMFFSILLGLALAVRCS